MSLKDRVLVIDDSKSYRKLMRSALTANGYEAITASGGMDGYAMITSRCPDVILLDPGLNDTDGMRLIRNVREWSEVPIIVISAQTAEKEKVSALDSGADDYIIKPFSIAELLARIRTQLRHVRIRSSFPVSDDNRIVLGDLTIELDKHRVLVCGSDAGLTENEFRIVSVLGRYAGKVIPYEQIMKEVWGPGIDENTRILRVNVANIRGKLEPVPSSPKYILTRRGVGYMIPEVQK